MKILAKLVRAALAFFAGAVGALLLAGWFVRDARLFPFAALCGVGASYVARYRHRKYRVDAKERQKFDRAAVFTANRIPRYAGAAVVLLLFARMRPFAVYYVIMAAVCIVLALLCIPGWIKSKKRR